MVKTRIENEPVTLISMYTPPKSCLIKLYLIVTETKDILTCLGKLDIIRNHKMDKTSLKKEYNSSDKVPEFIFRGNGDYRCLEKLSHIIQFYIKFIQDEQVFYFIFLYKCWGKNTEYTQCVEP